MSNEDYGLDIDILFFAELLKYPTRLNDSCDLTLNMNGDNFIHSNEAVIRSQAMARASWYNIVDYTGNIQRKILEQLYPGFVDLPEILQIAIIQRVMSIK